VATHAPARATCIQPCLIPFPGWSASARPWSRFVRRRARHERLFRQAKIQDLQASVFGKKNVVRLRVAMDDSFLMCRSQSFRDFLGVFASLGYAIRLEQQDYLRLREQVLWRDGWRCQSCGSMTNLEVHHREFRSHRGADDECNLITLCCDCHSSTHGYSSGRSLLRGNL